MQIGTCICGFLAGVIFALVVLAVPPAIVEFRHDARVAMAAACHEFEIDVAECDAIAAAPRRTDNQRTCET